MKMFQLKKLHIFVLFNNETVFSEVQKPQKGKQNQIETPGEASSSEQPDSSKPSEVKRRKTRSSPDPKWMDNGNGAWLECGDVNGIIFMFCK